METASGPKQRSPWFYVLLGCGGLLALMCLAGTIFALVVGKGMKSVAEGVSDPAKRQENALAQLGGIPPGYTVVGALSMFGLGKTTVLTDAPLDPDGGATLEGRVFMYRTQLMQKEQLAAMKDFFAGKPGDAFSLRQFNLSADPAALVKRTELTVDGRKLQVLVLHGVMNPMQSDAVGLTTGILFDCPDGAFRLGTWVQRDPPGTPRDAAPELTGTVGDEAELARFIKPINPCGR
jgi:hypothetical protein